MISDVIIFIDEFVGPNRIDLFNEVGNWISEHDHDIEQNMVLLLEGAYEHSTKENELLLENLFLTVLVAKLNELGFVVKSVDLKMLFALVQAVYDLEYTNDTGLIIAIMDSDGTPTEQIIDMLMEGSLLEEFELMDMVISVSGEFMTNLESLIRSKHGATTESLEPVVLSDPVVSALRSLREEHPFAPFEEHLSLGGALSAPMEYYLSEMIVGENQTDHEYALAWVYSKLASSSLWTEQPDVEQMLLPYLDDYPHLLRVVPIINKLWSVHHA